MQSQQMFNDCIAQTQVSRSSASPQKGKGKFAVSTGGLDARQHRRPHDHPVIHPIQMSLNAYVCSYVVAVSRGLEKRTVGCSTYFPAADSEEESQDIRLLLLLKLFDVLEGTHLGCF